jgi:glucokinase
MAPPRTAIGLDIGGTRLRAARVTADGRIEAHRNVPTRRDAALVLADALWLISELRAPGVGAIGVGAPGQVDAERREVLSGGYVDLSTIPFAQRLEDEAGLAVAVENDAAMALVAEHAVGAAKGASSVVLLTIGTGIGGAVLERGRLLRGRRSAGQLGHLVIDPDGPPCLCGRRGCLETLSAGPALARHMAEAGLPPETRAEDLLARPDGRAAASALRAWVRPLRQGIDTLVAALNPDLVLLGGGLGAAGAVALCDHAPPGPGWYHAPVRAAALGAQAGVIGAALAGLRATQAPAKRVVLVNGVPASGKSTVAHALSSALGWTHLALDTVKQPFLEELPPGDRLFNRTLGRASYRALFDLMRDAPAGSGFVLDAWFGFQPLDRLTQGLASAEIGRVAEIWCGAPPEEIGRRYAARVPFRGPGHPGLDYVPELVELAAAAKPTGLAPVRVVDTTQHLDPKGLALWVERTVASAP